jgi:hypothetical protein
MFKYKKILIGAIFLVLVFTVSFCYGYRNVLKKDVLSLYKNYLKVSNQHKETPNEKAVSASKIKESKDVSKDTAVIRNDMPVVFVDRKHYTKNGKDQIVDDVVKHSTSEMEGFKGKKIKDLYVELNNKNYSLEIEKDQIICVKRYTPGKYVAKLKGEKYEIFQSEDNGDLKLLESGGNINQKGEDEVIFNQNTEEYNTIEEARESLSDFTS